MEDPSKKLEHDIYLDNGFMMPIFTIKCAYGRSHTFRVSVDTEIKTVRITQSVRFHGEDHEVREFSYNSDSGDTLVRDIDSDNFPSDTPLTFLPCVMQGYGPKLDVFVQLIYSRYESLFPGECMYTTLICDIKLFNLNLFKSFLSALLKLGLKKVQVENALNARRQN